MLISLITYLRFCSAMSLVLPDPLMPSLKTPSHAKSLLVRFANEMGLDITAYIDWIRVERRLSSSLRALARWGFVALERRQREEGHKFWYNAYWKTDLAE